MNRAARVWAAVGAAVLLLVGVGLGVLLTRGGDAPTATAGPVDVGFSQDMSVHHAQAVDMATTELTGGSDERIKNLAFDILTTQQNQIGRMQGWLTAWGRPLLPTGGHMAWMGPDAPGAHEGHGMAGMDAMAKMPGMATSAELARLRQAEPTAKDVLFLQLMLRHHQGGVGMLEAAERDAEAGYVRDLAAQMLATQTSESALMTRLLADRNAPVLPMN